jgi:aryl-alcohol dehydrogenase-like predicted oxidoreductase
MTFGGKDQFQYMGNSSIEEATRLIDICLEAGVNLFDTADMYSAGRSEEVLAAAIRPERRHRAIIATKVFFPLDPKFMMSAYPECISLRHGRIA